jgi:hypothetical protein
MAELPANQTEPRAHPPTIIIDLPVPSATSLFFAFGGVIATVGLLVRVFARRMAWPQEWHYSGDRANTKWAFNEALYIDLGMVALAFGLALILLGLVRVTGRRANTTPT